MEIRLKGHGVSPGVGIGPVVTFHAQSIRVPRYFVADPKPELERFDEALGRVRQTLETLRDQTYEELGEQHAAIFDSHLEMLGDVTLRSEIEQRLASEQLNVEFLVDEQLRHFTAMLSRVDDPVFRERSTDFVDVGKRILGELLDHELDSLEHLEHPSVIVAHDLSPSETVIMDMPNILGLVTDGGGPTSHTAILARAHEIPSVVGLRFAEARVGAGDVIVVDGATGLVIIRPTESTLEYYKKEKARQDAERRAIAGGARDADSATIDGHEIATLVNIELPIEADSSLKQKCKGVGLFRTEFLFMNRPNLPSEEEQYGAYKRVLEVMNPLPVTIRTLDMGGDKIVTHVNREEETNPQLGWRSIRLCLDRPDIFKAQLRALYRASVHGNLQLMFPLVSGLDEFRQAKSMVEEVQEDLRARGISFDAKVKVGTMIEVPSAVAVASHLAEECAFFSIGTNDLIQYCLAVDRANDRTAHLYQPSHPGVLRLIKQTIEAAAKANIPCTICGEMAGDPLFTEVLIGMGLKNFSMSAVSFPVVRATLSRIKLTMARRFASKVLKMGSNSAVASAVAQRYEALSAQIRYERTEAAATVSTRPAQKE